MGGLLFRLDGAQQVAQRGGVQIGIGRELQAQGFKLLAGGAIGYRLLQLLADLIQGQGRRIIRVGAGVVARVA